MITGLAPRRREIALRTSRGCRCAVRRRPRSDCETVRAPTSSRDWRLFADIHHAERALRRSHSCGGAAAQSHHLDVREAPRRIPCALDARTRTRRVMRGEPEQTRPAYDAKQSDSKQSRRKPHRRAWRDLSSSQARRSAAAPTASAGQKRSRTKRRAQVLAIEASQIAKPSLSLAAIGLAKRAQHNNIAAASARRSPS